MSENREVQEPGLRALQGQAGREEKVSKGVMSEGGEKPGEVLQIKIKKVLLGNRNDLCQLLLMGQE